MSRLYNILAAMVNINSTNKYVKFGKLAICWGTDSKSVAAYSTDSSKYPSFPLTYASAPAVIVGLSAGGADLYKAWAVSGATTTTQFRLALANNYSSATTVGANWLAIGFTS